LSARAIGAIAAANAIAGCRISLQLGLLAPASECQHIDFYQ
jgi:hypothetical protein